MAANANLRATGSDLAEALDRTLLIIRDEVGTGPSNDQILAALTSTSVAVVADAANIASPAAQAALITAAILMARSGHRVLISAPNVQLTGLHPPLEQGRLVDQLLAVGSDLLPGCSIEELREGQEVDLLVTVGSSATVHPGKARFSINAQAWSGSIVAMDDAQPWNEPSWPIGAMIAGALAAGEAFKCSVRKLEQFFVYPPRTNAIFAAIRDCTVEAAPASTAQIPSLGAVDFVSGGAITNAALYVLASVPGFGCEGRVMEPQTADLTNLNRYMLLRGSAVGGVKADILSAMAQTFGATLTPVPSRYDPEFANAIEALAPTVVVGADDIPTRWLAQEARPRALIVGATTHWSAMASVHRAGSGCARCLHREDDPLDAVIPTTACVSFWAGLLVAVYLLRNAANALSLGDMQTFITPFRPERPTRDPMGIWADCPTCGGRGA